MNYSSPFYNTFSQKLKLIITKSWKLLTSYTYGKKRENCSKLKSLKEALWCFTWIRFSQSKNLTKENYYMSLLYYSTITWLWLWSIIFCRLNIFPSKKVSRFPLNHVIFKAKNLPHSGYHKVPSISMSQLVTCPGY